MPIRLIDELATAEIESPLLEEVRGNVRTDLERLKDKSVRTTDLLSRSMYRQRGCHLRGDGGLACGSEHGPFQVRFNFSTPPDTITLLVFEIRAPGSECVEFEVWDDSERHRRRLPGDNTEWRPVTMLWPAPSGGSRIRALLAKRKVAEPCRLEVRSAMAHTLERSPELTLELLKGRHLAAADSDPEIGIARFGPFLPLGDAETVEPPYDDNFSSREALLAPTPTDLRFRLSIPHGGRLLFSYALSRESHLGDHVDFEIRATGESGPERLLWSQQLELTEDNWHWHEAVVPLEELWGQTARLVLRTQSPTGQGFALWGSPTLDVPRRDGDPPNVIVIAIDTLRADRLSMYGYSKATTPRLEEFARDGVLFEHAISQSNWTIPSFASIFTGQIVARHREITATGSSEASAVTLSQLLRDHGWRTQAILYKPILYQRLHRGFEVHFNVPRKGHRADQNLQKALDWLQRSADQRFFLFLHFDDPHQPFTQPQEFVRPASADLLSRFGLRLPLHIPPGLAKCDPCMADGVVAEPFKTLARRLYDEEIHYLDDRIGRFLDALRQRGLYNDAVIAVVSDHGESFWNHHDHFGHGGINQHAELTRVPLILKAPVLKAPAREQYRRGAVVKTRVRAFDLMPTLLDLAGIEYAAGDLDADSLLPFLQPTDVPTPGDRVAFSQGVSSAAMLMGHWKYILPVGRGIGAGHPGEPVLRAEELYDLSRDPDEMNNLSGVYPQILSSLRIETFEYLLRTVGGRFLLVQGALDHPKQGLIVACDVACGWDPLLQFGLERVATQPPNSAIFEGPGLGNAALFARVLGLPAEVNLRLYKKDDSNITPFTIATKVPYEKGIVGRLLRTEEPGAWLLEAPERAIANETTESRMSAQQEEALRALGYIQ